MSSIRAQVEELGSWITGFEFEGTRYGGDYFPNDDSRVLRFVDAFRQWLRELPDRRRALRILECGCLEGGHTALLAKAFPEAEIVATDLREENLRKARFLVSLYGLNNVRWLPLLGLAAAAVCVVIGIVDLAFVHRLGIVEIAADVCGAKRPITH